LADQEEATQSGTIDPLQVSVEALATSDFAFVRAFGDATAMWGNPSQGTVMRCRRGRTSFHLTVNGRMFSRQACRAR